MAVLLKNQILMKGLIFGVSIGHAHTTGLTWVHFQIWTYILILIFFEMTWYSCVTIFQHLNNLSLPVKIFKTFFTSPIFIYFLSPILEIALEIYFCSWLLFPHYCFKILSGVEFAKCVVSTTVTATGFLPWLPSLLLIACSCLLLQGEVF